MTTKGHKGNFVVDGNVLKLEVGGGCTTFVLLKSLETVHLQWVNLMVYKLYINKAVKGFPGGASGKEPTCQCRRHKRHGFNLWVEPMEEGRSPGGGHDYPLQYSCLESPMDRGACQATVQGSQRVGLLKRL